MTFVTNEISTMTGVQHNIRKKLTYYSQINSNSNKISLFILKNLTLTSTKNLILSLKIQTEDFINNDDITPNCVC